MHSDTYLAFMAKAPKTIPHFQAWSNPDAETYITGINYYEHPRLCRQRMFELYPELELEIPASDAPKLAPQGLTQTNADGSEVVRWGDQYSAPWDWGKKFQTAEECLAFSPLEHADFRGFPIPEAFDYRTVDGLYAMFRENYPKEWGDTVPDGVVSHIQFYNTMFMWPMLVFGWDLFLEICLMPEFDRLMEEFAELSRRTFQAIARLPVNVVAFHDDIVGTRGLFCSPAWMRKHIYPRYEEFFDIIHKAGKRVTFTSDGRVDEVADEVFALGADGIHTEPYTDFKSIAQKYPQSVLIGEGDNRVLMRNNPDEITAMVRSMAQTAQMCDGYILCVGNHIPWNVPGEAAKHYLDACREYVHR